MYRSELVGQSRIRSLKETCSNIAIGYTINFTANAIILPFFVEGFTVQDNLIIGVFYTGISIVRLYCIRRWFNHGDAKSK